MHEGAEVPGNLFGAVEVVEREKWHGAAGDCGLATVGSQQPVSDPIVVPVVDRRGPAAMLRFVCGDQHPV